jgi:peptidyl-prolyl cis-trans isomerase SurA
MKMKKINISNIGRYSVAMCLSIGMLILSCSTHAKQVEQALDGIVATINDEVITQSEFHEALHTATIEMRARHLPPPPEKTFRKQVLDALINKKLQLQLAQQASIQVSRAELDQAIDQIAKQNQLSVNEFYQRINEDGIATLAYRRELRHQLIIQKLQQREITNHLTITPEEITDFMHSHLPHRNRTQEYHIEDFMIPLTEQPSSTEIAAAKKQAAAILALVKQGQHIQRAAQLTTHTHLIQRQDLNWRRLSEIPSAFVGPVQHMHVNGVTGPIQAANGLHILYLVGLRDSQASATPSRQQAEELLLQHKFSVAMQSWISKLRSRAFITINQS